MPRPPRRPPGLAGSAKSRPAAMAAPCPLLGDGVADDTLLRIASFLPTATDLLFLQLTCPRFAAKVIAAAPSVDSGGGGAAGSAAASAPEMLSIVEEAGRLWVVACSEQERLGVSSRARELAGSDEGGCGASPSPEPGVRSGACRCDACLRTGRWRRRAWGSSPPGGPRRARWRCGRGVTSRSSRWWSANRSSSA